MTPGDVVGHEPMGVVDEVGAEVRDLKVGDRVVVSVQRLLRLVLDVRAQGCTAGARPPEPRPGHRCLPLRLLLLYGQVPGGQAEGLRVPFGDSCPSRCRRVPPDDRFLYLSDVLPTAWQAVEYAAAPDGGTLLVMGAGPIGDMAARIARVPRAGA